MKYLVLVIALVISGCGGAPPNLSPKGKLAFNNNRVQKALDIIRDTAQDANAQVPPLVSTNLTRKITLWHESAIKVIHSDSLGWQATVNSGLDELLRDVDSKERQLLLPYVSLAKTILMEIK